MNIETIINSFKNFKKITNSSVKKFFKTHKNEEIRLNEILKNGPEWESIQNLIIGLIKNIKLKRCKMCGKTIKFSKQLSSYCSKKCMYSDHDIYEKIKQTNLEKYGVENPTKSNVIKEKIKETNLERYGTTSPMKSEEIKNKVKQTNLERYGVECVFQDESTKEKTRNTLLEKYGTSSPMKSEEIKNKVKQTNLERYGVEYVFQDKEITEKAVQTRILNGTTRNQFVNGNPFSRKEIIQLKKNNFIEKYGVENPMQSTEIKNKVKQTNLEKYGFETPSKNDVVKSKMSKTKHDQTYEANLNRFKDIVIPLFSKEAFEGAKYYDKKYKWKCCKCGSEFEDTCYSHIPRCLNCHPHTSGYSYMELELLDFVKQFFPNASKNKSIIYPKEIDIYIPELKLGIEFNGNFWHSESNGVDKFYHLNKTKLCEANEIRLIHIFEYEWKTKKEIVKNTLLSIFKMNDDKIYAKNCLIKEISTKMKNEFLNENHIQGPDNSKIKLGLFSNNELVTVMTFGKSKFDRKYEWELSRYATSKQVIDGSEALLKYFEKMYQPKSIITYADRRWTQGRLYEELGFEKINETSPNYFYEKDDLILWKYQCQKHKLRKLLGESFNENLTESENMKLVGFNKIFDCGYLIFLKNNINI